MGTIESYVVPVFNAPTLPTIADFDDVTSVSCTLIGTSSQIVPVYVRCMFQEDTFSSSNDFNAGEALYIWIKKDSTSGNQDQYFNVTISGEFD